VESTCRGNSCFRTELFQATATPSRLITTRGNVLTPLKRPQPRRNYTNLRVASHFSSPDSAAEPKHSIPTRATVRQPSGFPSATTTALRPTETLLRPRDHQVQHGCAEGVLLAADPDRRGVLRFAVRVRLNGLPRCALRGADEELIAETDVWQKTARVATCKTSISTLNEPALRRHP
jgi:hypothetical protein